MKRLFILCSGLLLILSGCSYLSALGGKTEESPTSRTSGYMKPDSAAPGKLAFDPMDLGPSVFAQNAVADLSSLSGDPEYLPSSDTGYRIQLGAFIDQARADNLAERAENELGEQAYVVFDRPFYRVRVGNFRDISEAEALKSNAISKGYQDARITRDVIEETGE
ncbi:SPOR domain-containing protein [bacterium]|nr:SPOR domain-containing protein [bacterium]MBU1636408.1 SPOR domain-containing protein [bacterium]